MALRIEPADLELCDALHELVSESAQACRSIDHHGLADLRGAVSRVLARVNQCGRCGDLVPLADWPSDGGTRCEVCAEWEAETDLAKEAADAVLNEAAHREYQWSCDREIIRDAMDGRR
jgi:hypothetical protein